MSKSVGSACFWTPSGWRPPTAKLAGPTRADTDWILPGLVNLHSHALQRAMAGLAERHGPGADSFWTWREAMYRFTARIEPADLHAIAAQLYAEMLESGYTHVCEFHYLHHRRDGQAYTPTSAMADALVAAAQETGIGLTLLPVLYMQGGFDGRPLEAPQRRFAHDVETFLQLLGDLHTRYPGLHLGLAFHSLRAVPAPAMTMLLENSLVQNGPIHIHIAEQTAEVEDCRLARGARPVAWLLDHAPVDARWCLVHATHMDEDETHRLAATGAVAGLCPTTEANLGDGLFPLLQYLQAGGRMGIGSDSHISVSPVEELRWLEYGQRLRSRGRNLVANETTPHTGERLFAAAQAGGWQAAGCSDITTAAGTVSLDACHPLLAARQADEILDSWIFAGNVPLVREVYRNNRCLVHEGRHVQRESIAARYKTTLARLRA